MSWIVTLLGTPRQWAREAAAAVAIGLFLGVIGPFGSFNGGPVEMRIPYWIISIWIGFICLTIVVRGSIRAAERLDLPIWFPLALGVALGSAPLCLAMAWFSRLFWSANHVSGSYWQWYGQTLVIAEPCAFAYRYFMTSHLSGPAAAAPSLTPTTAATASAPRSPAAPRFLERLPLRLGRELLCLQMEDHYVRVHMETGSDLVLTSLKEAMADLDGMDGLQVHRSWWVRRTAVEGVVTRGRNLTLRLCNGLEVPVSRASVARLRASGWLDSTGGSAPDNPKSLA